MSDRLVPLREVLERVPVNRTTIYRWVREGRFPKPKYLGWRLSWRERDLIAWMEADDATADVQHTNGATSHP